MQYKGRRYRITELETEPGKWVWTVRLSDRLHRNGTAPSRVAAEEDVMKAVDLFLARRQP
jgi:hypothetical protein